MRIRHYFTQLTQNTVSSYDLQPDNPLHPPHQDKKSSTLPKQTREKTSQTSPKKPLRSSTRKPDQVYDQDLGARIKQAGKRALTSSQSLRISSSVPTLGQSKGFVETDPKVKMTSKLTPLIFKNVLPILNFYFLITLSCSWDVWFNSFLHLWYWFLFSTLMLCQCL